MVEVDVFWAYGIGGSLAAAAGRQLKKEKAPLAGAYFSKTVLLLALIWAPTGLLLLLRHPSWETMQVAPTLGAIPPLLVLAFGITNVTQGILGFWVSQRLMARGQFYFAHLNWLAGYLGMFFILLYGWDGLGYDRFLYDRDMFGGHAWTPGAGMQAGAGVVGFLKSSVAETLYLDGVFLLPAVLGAFGRWTVRDLEADGVRTDGKRPTSALAQAALYLAAVFFLALPTAAALSLSVHAAKLGLAAAGLGPGVAHALSYAVGIPIAAIVLRTLVFRRGRPGHALVRKMYVSGDEAANANAIAPTPETP